MSERKQLTDPKMKQKRADYWINFIDSMLENVARYRGSLSVLRGIRSTIKSTQEATELQIDRIKQIQFDV